MTSTDDFSVAAAFDRFREDIPLHYRTVAPHTDAVALAAAFARGLDGSMFASGRSPSTIAATGLYVAPMVLDTPNWTQKEVSDWTGVSCVSIRQVYEDLPVAYAAEVDADDVPDPYLPDLRKWLGFHVRRQGQDALPDGLFVCPDCSRGTVLLDADDAAAHYEEDHPFQRYNPVRFTDETNQPTPSNDA